MLNYLIYLVRYFMASRPLYSTGRSRRAPNQG